MKPISSSLNTGATALLVALLAVGVTAGPAAAADNIFGSSSPLTVIRTFVTGPLAYTLLILGLGFSFATLVFGGDFSGTGKRSMIAVIAGAFIIFSEQVASRVFGATAGYDLPVEMMIDADWPSSPQPFAVDQRAQSDGLH